MNYKTINNKTMNYKTMNYKKMNHKHYNWKQACRGFCFLCIFLLIIQCVGCAATQNQQDTDQSSADSTETANVISNETSTLIAFPVGKGDAFLMYTDSGSILIDTGYTENGQAIADYIRNELGLTSIDYMLLTHYDKDHIGGSADIITNLNVKNIILNAFPKDNDEILALSNAIKAQNVNVIYPGYLDQSKEVTASPDLTQYNGQNYDVTIGQMKMTVYPCLKSDYDDMSNESSLITSIQYQNCSFLFTGDAEEERLNEFLDQQDSSHYDFVKMPYHGAYNKYVKKLIESATPSYAIITDSSEREVDDKTVSLLRKNSITALYTKEGMVTMHCDGTAITVSQE